MPLSTYAMIDRVADTLQLDFVNVWFFSLCVTDVNVKQYLRSDLLRLIPFESLLFTYLKKSVYIDFLMSLRGLPMIAL